MSEPGLESDNFPGRTGWPESLGVAGRGSRVGDPPGPCQPWQEGQAQPAAGRALPPALAQQGPAAGSQWQGPAAVRAWRQRLPCGPGLPHVAQMALLSEAKCTLAGRDCDLVAGLSLLTTVRGAAWLLHASKDSRLRLVILGCLKDNFTKIVPTCTHNPFA